VILIHGLASSPAVWDRFAPELAKARRVHRLHIAGFDAAAPAGNASDPILTNIAAEIGAYIRRENLEKPALVGHSMGGVIALQAAIQLDQRIAGALIVDALPFFSVLINPIITRIEAAMQADAARAALLAQSPAEFEEGQRTAIERLAISAVDRARALDWALKADRDVMARAMHEVMTTDLRLAIAQIRTPLSVLFAHDGAIQPPAALWASMWTANYAANPRVRLAMVENARHYIMLDQPERFMAEAASFLAL
jgi:pimeloyl-ACP methyl ester carboxylesterase